MVRSPRSAVGLGRQLVAEKISGTHTATNKNKLRRDMLILMGAQAPPDSLDRPKSCCRHGFAAGGVNRLYHIRGVRGNRLFVIAQFVRILTALCSTMRAAVCPP